MNIHIAPLTLLCTAFAAAQSVSPVAFTESVHSIRAFSPSGDVALPVTRLKLDIQHRNGKNERGDLVVIHDPATGHYLWRYRKLNSESDNGSFLTELDQGREAVYASPTALVDFFVNSELYIGTHDRKFPSIGAAERASMAEIKQGLPMTEGRGYYTDLKEIVLYPFLGVEFSCPPYGDPKFSPMCGFGIKAISSIAQHGDGWRVVLKGRWEQELILGSQFNLVSTRRLPDAPAK
jgi:hypothetical protein